MQIHDFIFITQLLCELEQNTVLKWCVLTALLTFLFRFFVLGESVETGCLKQMDLGVVFVSFHKFVVDIHSSSEVCVKGRYTYL
jgi:hypothetical protein